MNIEKNAVKLSHNPLGIIALFILLIYGFATLLFGFNGNVFSDGQRWWFVCFLTTFPLIVLIVFTILVIKHHYKLYAPTDFEDEKNWLYGIISPKEKEQELAKEEIAVSDNGNEKESREQFIKRRAEEREKRQKIENLVCEYYEKKFNFDIDRTTYFKINDNKIFFDGIVEKNDTLTFMRIKYLPNNYIIPRFLLDNTVFNAIKVKELLNKNGKYINNKFRLLLIFVVDTDDSEVRREVQKNIQNMIETESINIDLRTYMVKELEDGVKISQ
ncbi:MAG: hypothetical protein II610_00785 [Treponema sp.]|nr:hypothetical protein [Treponema sp.]